VKPVVTMAAVLAVAILAGRAAAAAPEAGNPAPHDVAAGPAYAPAAASAAASPAAVVPAYKVRVTNNNLVGLTTTNYGFFGNNFISRSPSFEYPLGTGIEHMVRGGVWIGALDPQGIHRVSTAAVDASQGSASAAGTEYSPLGNVVTERSKLPNSKYFSPFAVSEQDYVSDFADFPAKTSVTGDEDHTPLHVTIHQETYDWSFSRFRNFVAVHLQIVNTGDNPLRDLWVGMYEELASGLKSSYSTWPPSSTGSIYGSWYNKKLLRYNAPGRVLSEHYCRSSLDGGLADCNDAAVPPWVGVELLGVHPDTVANKQVTVFLANYAPGDTTRDQDEERYRILASGHVSPPDSLLPGQAAEGRANDPVSLIGVGPFDVVQVGDTISVDFAYVGGTDYPDLLANAGFAQLAFNFNYVVPTPPPSPRLAVVPNDRGLDLYWDKSPEAVTDPTSPAPNHQDFEGYRVYVGEDRASLREVAQFDKPDTTGFNTGFAAVALPDSVAIGGVYYHYRYHVGNLRDGFRTFVSVTAYDTGDDQIESLESGTTQNLTLAVPAPSPGEIQGKKVVVFPNPYKVEARWDAGRLVRDHYLWFANLPPRCHIKIFTLSGDLVKEVEFDAATYHGESARGLYNPGSDVDIEPPTLSGSIYAWDLISREGQAVASGLYVFAVEDAVSGEIQRGKFLVLKSDREGFR